MKTVKSIGVLAMVLLAGCATTAVSVSVLQNPGREVSAHASHFSVLWLSPISIERAHELLEELDEKCDGRGVTGITTKTSSTWVLVGQIERVEVTGYCVDG